jgi:hypothetical protein
MEGAWSPGYYWRVRMGRRWQRFHHPLYHLGSWAWRRLPPLHVLSYWLKTRWLLQIPWLIWCRGVTTTAQSMMSLDFARTDLVHRITTLGNRGSCVSSSHFRWTRRSGRRWGWRVVRRGDWREKPSVLGEEGERIGGRFLASFGKIDTP